MSEDKGRPIKDLEKLEMFKLYCLGKSIIFIANKFGLEEQTVYYLSKEQKWKDKKTKLINKKLEKYKDEIGDVTIKALRILQAETDRLLEKIQLGSELDKDERKFVSDIFDKFSKEKRLEEGKPTENIASRGIHEYHVHLPEGANRYGVFAPLPSTKLISEKPKEVPEETTKDIKEDEEDIY